MSKIAKRITIIADDRESNGANPYFPAYITANNSEFLKKSDKVGGGKLDLCIKRITTGDYTVLIHPPGMTKPIIAMIIERKTWKDLSASLTDGRSKGQHAEMLKMQEKIGCKLGYLIEGNLSYKSTARIGRKPFKNLDAKVRHMQIRGINVYRSKNSNHSAEVIVNLARDMYALYKRGDVTFEKQITTTKDSSDDEDSPLTLMDYVADLEAINDKYKQAFDGQNLNPSLLNSIQQLVDAAELDDDSIVQEDIQDEVETVVGAAEELAEKEGLNEEVETLVDLGLLSVHTDELIIPKELTDRKIKADSDLLMNMWMAIPMITDKSAPSVMKEFKLAEILAATPDQAVNYTRRISEMTYPSGTKIGEVRAKKIMAVSYSGSAATKKEKVKIYSAKILAEVPGITLATAKKILEEYSLRDICARTVTAEQVSKVKKTETRAVGKKSASKLIELLRS